MMDGVDLSWKLAHVLLGLAKDKKALLETYEVERRDNALNLIDMDKRWYNARYRKGGQEEGNGDSEPKMTVKWNELQIEIMSFITGTGVEYEAETAVTDKRRNEGRGSAVEVEGYSFGVLREGRRLADGARLVRFVNGNNVDLQKECGFDGSYTVVVFATRDLLDKDSKDWSLVEELCMLVQGFGGRMVKLVVVQPRPHLSFEWADLPEALKELPDTSLLSGSEQVYKKYGVSQEEGVVVVVRPDQCVGSIAEFQAGASGIDKVKAYLNRLVNVNP